MQAQITLGQGYNSKTICQICGKVGHAGAVRCHRFDGGYPNRLNYGFQSGNAQISFTVSYSTILNIRKKVFEYCQVHY